MVQVGKKEESTGTSWCSQVSIDVLTNKRQINSILGLTLANTCRNEHTVYSLLNEY